MKKVSSKVFKRYAKALYENIRENNKIKEEDIENLYNLINNSKDLKLFLTSPIHKIEHKISILDEIIKTENKKDILNFFISVFNGRRETALFDILKETLFIINENKGIKTVTVIFAIEPSQNIIEELKKELIKQLKCNEVRLIIKINKNLIGGLIIEVDNMQINLSLQGKLNKIKNLILN